MGFDIENFPTSDAAKRMLSYVSEDFYEKSYVGKWLYQVMGEEWDDAKRILGEELPKQFFPETATWGLMYHELKWGLPVMKNLSYEDRRKLIYQKRDIRSSMTPYRMEAYLKNATGFDVRVADINDPGDFGKDLKHPNSFKVIFCGEGTIDVKEVKEILNKIKQSHTVYEMDDLSVIVLDARNLEYFTIPGIRFCIGMSFWACYVLDGSFLLDGSTMLNQKRRYNLAGRLKCCMGIPVAQWHTGFPLTEVLAGIYMENAVNAGTSYHLGINFRNGTDSESKLEMCFQIDSVREEIGAVSVITKTEDYWFLDGSTTLDGSKCLDSVYREENVL